MDVWSFDFNAVCFKQEKLTGPAVEGLKRSNHCAVYYKPHNSIYVFGGGSANRVRFNDTLKLKLDYTQDDQLN